MRCQSFRQYAQTAACTHLKGADALKQGKETILDKFSWCQGYHAVSDGAQRGRGSECGPLAAAENFSVMSNDTMPPAALGGFIGP